LGAPVPPGAQGPNGTHGGPPPGASQSGGHMLPPPAAGGPPSPMGGPSAGEPPLPSRPLNGADREDPLFTGP
ncbi:MAG TPA: hypothetical protein VFV01_49370, partial [Spirillospora sp.]|nr:hypothetical protein [Spirillospora sp.]